MVAHECTEGNIFFLKQYLRSLGENELLYLDVKASTWEWDSNRIASSPRCFDVVERIAHSYVVELIAHS
jgi:predicted ATPase